MKHKFFAKPIEITVAEKTLKFSSLADFKFCLAGRSSVPSQKIIKIFKFSTNELKKEARTIKRIEKHFVSILSKYIEDIDSINRDLRELDPQIFSQDNDWRLIINSLREGGEELNPFRRVALVKYIQYLSSRQEIIKYLFSEKNKGKKIASEQVDEGDSLKDTLTLKNTVFELTSEGGHAVDIERMLKGENVKIALKAGKPIDVYLSKHHCQIVPGEVNRFIDQDKRSYDLKVGRNMIGRDAKNDIIVDSKLRDVSRTHLLIEPDKDSIIYMTDFSSHGTFIASSYLESRSFI